mmetsp:Transcript_56239/g.100831  ORF Transcript_56239/g.100831 Transcript_56239/m.100831 type:complete len:240 (+) Transcript_56239:18-737(+)
MQCESGHSIDGAGIPYAKSLRPSASAACAQEMALHKLNDVRFCSQAAMVITWKHNFFSMRSSGVRRHLVCTLRTQAYILIPSDQEQRQLSLSQPLGSQLQAYVLHTSRLCRKGSDSSQPDCVSLVKNASPYLYDHSTASRPTNENYIEGLGDALQSCNKGDECVAKPQNRGSEILPLLICPDRQQHADPRLWQHARQPSVQAVRSIRASRAWSSTSTSYADHDSSVRRPRPSSSPEASP